MAFLLKEGAPEQRLIEIFDPENGVIAQTELVRPLILFDFLT